jgi:type IV secretory pathway VirB10-like protein
MSDFPPDDLPEWSAEERALWNSALDDRPPSRSLSAALQAVGVGSAITTAASGAGAGVVAKAGTGLVLFKWGAVVGLAGAVAVGGGVVAQRTSAPAEKPQPLATAAAPRAAERETPRVEEPRPEPESAEKARAPQPAARAPGSNGRASTAARSSATAASQPDIAEEIQNIDSARALIRQGRTKEALAALDRGKSKSLGVEATVLRIEALMRQGDRARATALANSFLAAHPKSPYAARIRTLLRNSER